MNAVSEGADARSSLVGSKLPASYVFYGHKCPQNGFDRRDQAVR